MVPWPFVRSTWNDHAAKLYADPARTAPPPQARSSPSAMPAWLDAARLARRCGRRPCRPACVASISAEPNTCSSSNAGRAFHAACRCLPDGETNARNARGSTSDSVAQAEGRTSWALHRLSTRKAQGMPAARCCSTRQAVDRCALARMRCSMSSASSGATRVRRCSRAPPPRAGTLRRASDSR